MRKIDFSIQVMIAVILFIYIFFPNYLLIPDKTMAIIWMVIVFLDAIVIGLLHKRIDKSEMIK